jgi:hypothetical protein
MNDITQEVPKMSIGLESYYERVRAMSASSLKKFESRVNEEFINRNLKSLTLQELAKLIGYMRKEKARRAGV